MQKKSRKLSLSKTNYLIDFSVFIAFLFIMDPRATGIANHEWLSVAFTLVIIIHLLLHWTWIVAVSKRFLRKLVVQARLNFILNIFFFIFMTVAIFTGIMISEVALPLFGIHFEKNFTWRFLHNLSADITLIILGLHIALHWKWIVLMTKRYFPKYLSLTNSSNKKTQLKENQA